MAKISLTYTPSIQVGSPTYTKPPFTPSEKISEHRATSKPRAHKCVTSKRESEQNNNHRSVSIGILSYREQVSRLERELEKERGRGSVRRKERNPQGKLALLFSGHRFEFWWSHFLRLHLEEASSPQFLCLKLETLWLASPGTKLHRISGRISPPSSFKASTDTSMLDSWEAEVSESLWDQIEASRELLWKALNFPSHPYKISSCSPFPVPAWLWKYLLLTYRLLLGFQISQERVSFYAFWVNSPLLLQQTKQINIKTKPKCSLCPLTHSHPGFCLAFKWLSKTSFL